MYSSRFRQHLAPLLVGSFFYSICVGLIGFYGVGLDANFYDSIFRDFCLSYFQTRFYYCVPSPFTSVAFLYRASSFFCVSWLKFKAVYPTPTSCRLLGQWLWRGPDLPRCCLPSVAAWSWIFLPLNLQQHVRLSHYPSSLVSAWSFRRIIAHNLFWLQVISLVEDHLGKLSFKSVDADWLNFYSSLTMGEVLCLLQPNTAAVSTPLDCAWGAGFFTRRSQSCWAWGFDSCSCEA